MDDASARSEDIGKTVEIDRETEHSCPGGVGGVEDEASMGLGPNGRGAVVPRGHVDLTRPARPSAPVYSNCASATWVEKIGAIATVSSLGILSFRSEEGARRSHKLP